MKLLITGTSGFVGQFLQKTLAGQAHHAVTLSRGTTEDLLKAESYPGVYQQVDTLIHLAGRAHVMHETAEDIYQAYAAVNIDYTLKVAELARRLKIKRFVFLSSVKVNGEASSQPFTEADTPAPLDAYGQTKLEAETALKAFCAANDMELVIIRPPLIYGPGVKANFRQLIKLCLLPLPLPFAAVHNKRSFISLDNLADFIVLCSWHPKAAGQTFLISDGEDLSTATLIKTIRQASKKHSLLIPLPAGLLTVLFKLIGKSSLALRLMGSLQVDITKAKTLLGWQPKISFHEGIVRTLKE
ncbi:MAG: NAD-dependent epimerase/dehydratase family protein [Methylophilus sp.]|uniref:NAD-dependent epimerase/dehydratase family protein n=1 Tax=Methylophilus sp. TaxID=29541 RepID=UPI003FA0C862